MPNEDVREKEKEPKLVVPPEVNLKEEVHSDHAPVGDEKSALGEQPSSTNSPNLFPFITDDLEILEQIGEGGMGRVYKARNKKTGTLVAIKLLRAELASDPAALKRFETECEAASQLNHPHLVSVFGHGATADGSPYLVMQLIDGESLSSILKRHNKLPAQRVLDICLQICEALTRAHSYGIVHRDLKPSNILISAGSDGKDFVHIVDFGIAKVLPSASGNRETYDLTETEAVFGSPHYMSPEQCLGLKLDHRSDIYSLGCVLYEALTGKTPFAANNPVQIVVKHINDPPQPFAQKLDASDRALGKGFESVVLKCLAKENNERYQSVEELEKDLQAIKDGRRPRAAANTTVKSGSAYNAIVIGSLAIILGLVFVYGLSVAGEFRYDFNDNLHQVLGIGSAILNFVGTIYFFYFGLKAWRARKGANSQDLDWWSCLIAALMPIVCASGFLAAMGLIFPLTQEPGQVLIRNVVGNACIVNVFGMVIAFATIVGALLFARRRVTSLTNRVGRLVLVWLVLLILPFGFIPKKVSVLTGMTAHFITERLDAPESAGALYWLTAKLNPANAQNYGYWADTMTLSHHPRDAVKMLTSALKEQPVFDNLPVLYSRRALAYKALGEWQNALDDFDKSVNLYQDNSFEFRERALVREQLGDLNGAVADLSKALELFPEERAYKDRIRVYCKQHKYDLAIQDQTARIKLATGDRAENYLMRGQLFEMAGLKPEARKDYERAIELSTVNLGGYEYAYRALAYKRLGKLEEYQHHIERAERMGISKKDLRDVMFMTYDDSPAAFEIIW